MWWLKKECFKGFLTFSSLVSDWSQFWTQHLTIRPSWRMFACLCWVCSWSPFVLWCGSDWRRKGTAFLSVWEAETPHTKGRPGLGCVGHLTCSCGRKGRKRPAVRKMILRNKTSVLWPSGHAQGKQMLSVSSPTGVAPSLMLEATVNNETFF